MEFDQTDTLTTLTTLTNHSSDLSFNLHTSAYTNPNYNHFSLPTFNSSNRNFETTHLRYTIPTFNLQTLKQSIRRHSITMPFFSKQAKPVTSDAASEVTIVDQASTYSKTGTAQSSAFPITPSIL